MVFDKIKNAWYGSKSVTTDTRKLKKGDLFFALKGDNFDGNTFAGKALEIGANLVVIDDPAFDSNDERIVLVPDVLKALQDFGKWRRTQFHGPVIGITGTNGKTTTKELVHAVLVTEKKVHYTQGNLNNHIGVPLTLLAMPDDTEIAVIEMGANKRGDIEELVNIALPTIGLITNIGHAHLEGFGSVEGVRITKGEMFDFFKSHTGEIWVNEADEKVKQNAGSFPNQKTYGLPTSTYHLASQHFFADHSDLVVKGPAFPAGLPIRTALVGRHNAMNVLVAVMAGAEMGISPENIQKGIAGYQPKMNRTEIIQTANLTVMMDAYNANPSSMEAAIRSIFDLDYGKRALVLGDMFELGPESEALHAALGKFVAQFSPYRVIWIGKAMKAAFDSGKGLPQKWYETVEDAKAHIEEDLAGAEFILLKGSRGMALERLKGLILPA